MTERNLDAENEPGFDPLGKPQKYHPLKGWYFIYGVPGGIRPTTLSVGG